MDIMLSFLFLINRILKAFFKEYPYKSSKMTQQKQTILFLKILNSPNCKLHGSQTIKKII